MNDSEDIRGLLADAQAPPPGVDLDAVLTRGHRRLARRRAAEVTGGASLVLVLAATTVSAFAWRSHHSPFPTARPSTATPSTAATPTPAPPTTTCRPTTLAIPAGYHDVSADVVDPTGRYIGGHATVGQDYVAIMWTDGVPKVLPIHAESTQIGGINSDGVAVGEMDTNNYADRLIFRYQDGVVTTLRSPEPKDWNLYPQPFINDAGVVVVNAEPPHEAGGANSIVIEWPAGQDTGRVLDIPKMDDVMGIGDNVMVGGEYPDGVGEHALVWDLGGHLLQTLSQPNGLPALAYAVAGDWATGGIWEGDHPTAARWDLRTGAYEQLAALDGPLNTVNAKGWTVDGTRAWLDGEIGVLALPPGREGQRIAAVAISDNGIVVGSVTGPDNKAIPIAWHC